MKWAAAAPCTVEDFRRRVETFLERITNGKEISRVRLVIETGDGKDDSS